jgi:hypothetical protein
MAGHEVAGPNPGATDDRSRLTDWLAILDDTRNALANLRAGDLEALAARAQAFLDEASSSAGLPAHRAQVSTARSAPLQNEAMQKISAGHRVLGELLHATAGNLAVLRRSRGRHGEPEGLPWVR